MTYFNAEIWNFNLNLYFAASEYTFINSLRNWVFWWCSWLTPSQIIASLKKHPSATHPGDLSYLVCLSRDLPHPSCFLSYTGASQQSCFRLQVKQWALFCSGQEHFDFKWRGRCTNPALKALTHLTFPPLHCFLPASRADGFWSSPQEEILSRWGNGSKTWAPHRYSSSPG